MKHAIAWTISLGLFLGASITHNSALNAQEHTMNDKQKQVLKTVETMTAAFQSGQIDDVLAQFEDKASVSFEPQNPTTDKDSLIENFTQFSMLKPIFTYAGHDVIINGDIALHIAPWTMKGTMPDGSGAHQSGLSVSVLRQQADGSWKLVIDNPHGQILMDKAQ